ncbi:hypothetical protein C3L33_02106, partial [Rhododendron williamsianum]
MAFIAFFLLLLALCKLPSTLPTGSALDLSDSTSSYSSDDALVPSIEESYSSANAVVPSVEEEKKPRKKPVMCTRNPKSCKKLSKHHSCCFRRTCVNLYSSRSNCGSCGHVCEHGKKCCRGICVDLQKDRNHCGKCRNVCLSGDNCVFGMCGYD